MLKIPSALQAQFETALRRKAIPQNALSSYLKWLRTYLDFCQKYHFSETHRESLAHFLRKLDEKRQSKAQQREASHAITLYYEAIHSMGYPDEVRSFQKAISPVRTLDEPSLPSGSSLREVDSSKKISPPEKAPDEPSPPPPPSSSSSQPARVTTGVSWKAEYTRLAREIQVRHYSPKTLKAYTQWVRHYQTFTRSQDPKLLSPDHVKAFLTFLAVTRKVSASTQNQAFNALLFFHRHVLNKEFGTVDGVVRAKRKTYIPVVLSREEIEAVLRHLGPPFDLVVKLLYGCGLRLFECLKLRVQCFNFDAGS
jgi:site-specific recombinase XerD